jgi:hypothetical protein
VRTSFGSVGSGGSGARVRNPGLTKLSTLASGQGEKPAGQDAALVGAFQKTLVHEVTPAKPRARCIIRLVRRA